jgi:hypothetical protein
MAGYFFIIIIILSLSFASAVKYASLDLSYNAFTGSLSNQTLSFDDGGFFSIEQNQLGPDPPILRGGIETAIFALNKFQLPARLEPPYELPTSIRYAFLWMDSDRHGLCAFLLWISVLIFRLLDFRSNFQIA